VELGASKFTESAACKEAVAGIGKYYSGAKWTWYQAIYAGAKL
jgi:hypothetical protein